MYKFDCVQGETRSRGTMRYPNFRFLPEQKIQNGLIYWEYFWYIAYAFRWHFYKLMINIFPINYFTYQKRTLLTAKSEPS